MSTTNRDNATTASKPQHFPVPDGKSELPAVLPDFPPPISPDPIPPADSKPQAE
jgi:hypothetical protein